MSTGILDTPFAPARPPTTRPRMSEHEFLALPDDGIDRWLIDGELREFGTMTKRNKFHSRAMTRVAKFLDNWLDTQPESSAEVLCGEAGVRLQSGKIVGVDVAYVSADAPFPEDDDSTLVVGAPTLIAEILSPSDTEEIVNQKLDIYRAAGIAIVWVIDTHDRTVTVYRPGQAPVLFNETQDLAAEPELPGFSVRVAKLFRRR
jgi:Uma2 family endonuclease